MKSSLMVSCFVVLLVTLVYADGQIDIAYSPYTISQAGSYIVVKDITAGTDAPCISINTCNVTIDLNGHTLYGNGHSADGISAPTGISYNITITNGIVRDWGASGIALNGNNYQISKVKAYKNGHAGFWSYSQNGTLTDCVADGNSWDGFHCDGKSCIIKGCVAVNNIMSGISLPFLGDDGAIIISNNVSSNSSYGIYARSANSITGNIVYNNSNAGIYVDNGNSITGNTISSNSSHGIYAIRANCITGNSVYNNRNTGIYVFDGNSIIGNSVYSNGNTGILVETGCTIKDNTVYLNSEDGIFVWNYNQVLGNTISVQTSGTFGVGINVQNVSNRLDSNHIVGNRIGINFASATNWYGRNTFSGSIASDTAGSVPSADTTIYPFANRSF